MKMAQARLGQQPTFERRLDNGLMVLVREERSAPVVAIVTHVAAGYFDEPERLVGISHVLEHMYFKGTERRAAGEMARETKAAGGYLNAGTIYDHTSYYTVLPSSALEQGLDIQSDALRHSAIEDDELRRELQVIIQEAKRKLDNPSAVAQETLFESMFDVHRIRRWRIGTEEALTRLTREDVWSYYRNLYRPSNIVLVVAGDASAEQVFSLAAHHYGGMPAGEPVRDRGPEEPHRREFRFREISGDIGQTRIEFGWRTPGALHADTAPLDLLAVVLGQGRASRLFRAVREVGLANDVSAYNYTPRALGVFGVSAEVRPGDAESALDAIAVTVAAAARSVAEAELERARTVLEARLLRRHETVEGQANLLAEWQSLGDWRLADEYYDRILSSTRADLERVAREYLTDDLATVLVYRPTRAASVNGDPASLHARLARAAARAAPADATTPAVRDGVGTTPDAQAAAAHRAGGAPTTALAPDRIEDGVRFYTAGNGLPIVIKPRQGSGLVAISLCCAGGRTTETPMTAGTTALMARTSLKGTALRDAAALAEATESLGGAITPYAGADLTEWRITLPARHFERGLVLLLETALEPAFPQAELERERDIALSDLDDLRDDMHQYPLRLCLSTAFNGHSYGFSIEEVEGGLRAADRGAVAAWHERTVLRARPWLFVVGDVDADRAAAAASPRLRIVEPGAPPDRLAPPTWPAASARRVASREKAQTALVLGFPGPARNEPDLYALKLLSNAVSGLGGRLFEELRSRHALAYAVSAQPMSRLDAGAFIAYIGTAPEREAEARQRMLDELDTLRREPLETEELERAQRYTIGAWKIRTQTNGAQLSDLSAALLLGDGLDELRSFEREILAVTPERIRETAARWIDPERVIEGVVRGRTVQEPGEEDGR